MSQVAIRGGDVDMCGRLEGGRGGGWMSWPLYKCWHAESIALSSENRKVGSGIARWQAKGKMSAYKGYQHR
jgi:hypothetical protein